MSDYSKNNDEIDLLEVISILWSKKWWIVLSSFVFTSIAGLYVFTAKEQWTSKAEVIAPKLTELGDYFTVRKEYARILGLEFNVEELSSDLFGKFNINIESSNKRREFFESSNFYMKATENETEQDKSIILSHLIKSFVITKPGNAKKEVKSVSQYISFSAESPQIAKDILGDFIAFNSRLSFQEEMNSFLIEFEEVLKDLDREKMNLERDMQIQRSIQLNNLNTALKIAREAGISTYQNSFKDGNYLFLLGEKYLQAQIAIVSGDTLYTPRYYVVTGLLDELKVLLEKSKKVKAQAFSYQASPDYPVVKDKPKKSLILAIGLFIGLVLSILVVLVLSFINRKK